MGILKNWLGDRQGRTPISFNWGGYVHKDCLSVMSPLHLISAIRHKWKVGNTKYEHNKCLNWLKINNITESLAAWLKQLLFCNLNDQVHNNNNEKVMLNNFYDWVSFMMTHLHMWINHICTLYSCHRWENISIASHS